MTREELEEEFEPIRAINCMMILIGFVNLPSCLKVSMKKKEN